MRSLLIRIVTPAPRGSTSGNRVTALRWARALRRLGHRVVLETAWQGAAADVLVALHAKKSHKSIARFAAAHPRAPLVVALTGTDLYQDLPDDLEARASIARASRIVVLQERALVALGAAEREKARVIVQSASRAERRERIASGFVACVLAHLRAVKDPLRAAVAARSVPADSKLRVIHAGAAPDPDLGRAAEREARENPRYTWLGALPRARALSLLAGSDLLVVTSLAEGGANVVTEAIACELPVISTYIEGSVGLLGADHPGYYPPGDTDGLATLLTRVERDAELRGELQRRSRALSSLVSPARESESWRALIDELHEHPVSIERV